MIETYRGTVYPWECDFFGHLNVRHYIAKFDEATWQFLSMYGLSPNYLKNSGTGIFTVEQHVKYHHELVAGDLIIVKSKLLQIKPKVVEYQHVIINTQTQEIAAQMKLKGVLVDLISRRSCPFPSSIHNRLVEALAGQY